jgi:aminopeptidase-like protein
MLFSRNSLLQSENEYLYGEMYDLVEKLFPITRSITGNGVRTTLEDIQKRLPSLKVVEVPSGTQAFDWTIPPEWNIREAFIADSSGNRIVDFQDNNLHVIGYSAPVDKEVTLEELKEHLHSIPSQPDAIPFVTSFYERRWGFCVRHNTLTALGPGTYHVYIDADLEPGHLTYGELVFPGETSDEILLSTYVCHPSLANDNLSGPVVTTFLAEWLRGLGNRRYTYRILYIPETIGSIVYLSRNLKKLKKHVVAGFVLTCVGDDRTFSFLPSRRGDTLADRVARCVLNECIDTYDEYAFSERGSDERQYCSPGVDLPVVSIMRSKYGEYPEYHTSDDDLSLVTSAGLGKSYEIHRRCMEILEANRAYRTQQPCEPKLSNRGLYPTLGGKEKTQSIRDLLDVYMYADGAHDLIEIANTLGLSSEKCQSILDILVQEGLIRVAEE